MKGVSRRDFDMVLAWSVDRLGRSLTGLLELLTELHAKHVDLRGRASMGAKCRHTFSALARQ
jgi:hypothetical protein